MISRQSREERCFNLQLAQLQHSSVWTGPKTLHSSVSDVFPRSLPSTFMNSATSRLCWAQGNFFAIPSFGLPEYFPRLQLYILDTSLDCLDLALFLPPLCGSHAHYHGDFDEGFSNFDTTWIYDLINSLYYTARR